MWRYILIVTDQFTRCKETLNRRLLIQTIYAAEKRKKHDDELMTRLKSKTTGICTKSSARNLN